MFIGASVIISALVGVYVASYFKPGEAPNLPSRMVVYFEFKDALREAPTADPFHAPEPTVRQLVDALDAAAGDARVQGFLARISSGSLPLTQVEEVRAAIKRFRASGKFAYVYSSSYGEAGGGLSRFYLASAFEERWMQPMGIVSIGGVKVEIPHFREALDWLGVQPDFMQRKEYKTAYESLTSAGISPQNKQMMEGIVATIRSRILQDVPADIGVKPAEFERLVNIGLFPAEEALATKLITHSNYADVLVKKVNAMVTGDPETEEEIFVDLGHYDGLRQQEKILAAAMLSKKPRVALIYASGAIMDTAGEGAFGADGIAAADEIAPAIMEAAEDETIGAIVLRIDSPGGSPVASESILRAVYRAKGMGKTVIVSMGGTAASGGYWIAAYADRIFALPMTITGSIGVLGGKFATGALWDTLKVNWDTGAQWGENAGMWSINTPFSAPERARIDAMLDQVYSGFTERVAKGRKMTPEQVDKIARGRVWTGADAMKIGLVDELGGLDAALDYAARTLKVGSRKDIEIVQLPEPKTPLELILQTLAEQGLVYHNLKAQAEIAAALKPVLGSLASDARLMSAMPPAMTYERLRIE